MIEEIIRRGVRLGYDVEVLSRKRQMTTTHHISIYDYHPTNQPGYEYPRLFRGNASGALKWIEEREAYEGERLARMAND